MHGYKLLHGGDFNSKRDIASISFGQRKYTYKKLDIHGYEILVRAILTEMKIKKNIDMYLIVWG